MSRAMWMELVLGAAAAVLVIMFLTGSFSDNKEAQAAMADIAIQTNDQIQLNLEESGAGIVSTSYTLSSINSTCKAGNTTTVYLTIGGVTYGFLESTTSVSSLSTPNTTPPTTAASLLSDTTKKYAKTKGTDSITYTRQ